MYTYINIKYKCIMYKYIKQTNVSNIRSSSKQNFQIYTYKLLKIKYLIKRCKTSKDNYMIHLPGLALLLHLILKNDF